TKTKHKRIAAGFLALAWALSPGLRPAEAIVGISTKFVDVTIEYVQVGKTYNLRELRRVPYAVTNKGTSPIDIAVDILAPKKEELVESYQALPDASWIRIVPNKFRIEPGQTGYAEMILAVPNDPQYTG